MIFFPGLNGIHIIDATDPANLFLLDVSEISGSAGDLAVYSSVLVLVMIANTADSAAGLQIISLNQGQLMGTPTQLQLGATISIQLSAFNQSVVFAFNEFQLTIDEFPYLITATLSDQSLFPGETLSLSFKSDTLFSNPGNSFLEIYASLADNNSALAWLSVMITPISIGNVANSGGTSIFIQNDLLFVGSNHLKIFDVSLSSNLILLSQYQALSAIYDIAIEGDIIFLVEPNANAIEIISINNLETPYLINTLELPTPQMVVVEGNIIFVIDQVGLKIINITDMNHIRVIGNYSTSTPFGIAVQENVAVVVDLIDGIKLINISNLTNPQLASTYTDLNVPIRVALQNSIAFVTHSLSNMEIIDISNVIDPKLISTCCDGTIIQLSESYIIIESAIVFLGDSQMGLQVVSIRNLTHPRIVGSYYTPGLQSAVNAITVKGNVAYILDYQGLEVLDISRWQLAANPTASDVGNYEISVTATDELGGSASTSFTIRVEGPPQIHGVIPTQYAKVNQAFNYFVPQGLITDPNFDPITFNATLSSGQLLPAWLQFNAISATFAGTAAK